MIKHSILVGIVASLACIVGCAGHDKQGTPARDGSVEPLSYYSSEGLEREDVCFFRIRMDKTARVPGTNNESMLDMSEVAKYHADMKKDPTHFELSYDVVFGIERNGDIVPVPMGRFFQDDYRYYPYLYTLHAPDRFSAPIAFPRVFLKDTPQLLVITRRAPQEFPNTNAEAELRVATVSSQQMLLNCDGNVVVPFFEELEIISPSRLSPDFWREASTVLFQQKSEWQTKAGTEPNAP